MKTFLAKIIILTTVLFVSNYAYSQWDSGQINVHLSLPEVTLVDIEPGLNNSINFSVSPALNGGDSPTIQNTSNETLWINYTSALPDGQNTRSINAEISQGTLPEGISLYLEASPFSGTGDGQLGISAGKTELTNAPSPIITDIGSCYTGDGVSNGHQLTFSIQISDYSKIYAADNQNYVVLYTITDN
ncbi:MAG TPA: hypothetical protein VKA38_14575 [Draconibacterium sp.]|nr:hypothetical protein [Draconibacterium sp.]